MNCRKCAENFTGLKDLVKHATKNWHSYQCSDFLCIPCSLPLHKLSNVIDHIEKDYHSIMALATGIQFHVKNESPDSSSPPFPPKKCCILCGSRDGNPYQQHLNSFTHLNTASLLRTILRTRTIDCFALETKDARNLVCKMVKVKQQQALVGDVHTSESFLDPLPFVCELCNIYFNSDECYKQHLENQSHKRMVQFIAKMFSIVKEVCIVGEGYYMKFSDTFSNSLPPLYYCGFCCLWVEKTPSYIQHTQSAIHRRIEELSSKLSNKRNGDAVGLPLKKSHSVKNSAYSHSNYCNLCAVWISFASTSRTHHKDIGHCRIERFLNSLFSDEDKKFINVYIKAEAQMMLSNIPPRNYCELCNILHSKSEKYKQHLQTDEHKCVEKYYSEERDNIIGEKALKKLKTSFISQSCCSRNSINVAENKMTDVEKRGKAIKFGTADKMVVTGTDNEAAAGSEDAVTVAVSEDTVTVAISKDKVTASNSKNMAAPTVSESKIAAAISEDKIADDDLEKEHYCELCEFICYNSSHYTRHLEDQKHKKMRRMLNKKRQEITLNTNGSQSSGSSHPLQYNCELCDVFNRNYQEYQFHLISPRHKKNQWLLYVFKQKCL